MTDVTERIKAVQRMFWALLAIGLVVALIGLPLGDDAATMDALSELKAFQGSFDREGLERDLVSRASAQGEVQLAEVAGKVKGAGTPKLRAAQGAAPVKPDASLALASLAQINALGRAGSTLEIGTASADALAQGIGWRLSRQPGASQFELTGIQLSRGGCSQADVDREPHGGGVDRFRERLGERHLSVGFAAEVLGPPFFDFHRAGVDHLAG